MKLKDITEEFPGFSLASAEDNESILNFLNDIPLKGNLLNLSYNRSPDFFKLLFFNHLDPIVIISRDKRNEILGIATLLVSKENEDEKSKKIIYIGDLRIKPSLEHAISWRKFFAKLIEYSDKIDEFRGAQEFYTCIPEDFSQGENSLIFSKNDAFSFQKINQYKTFKIFKKASTQKHNYSYRSVRAEDFELVDKFFLEQKDNLDFQHTHTEWRRRFNLWPNYHEKHFYLFFHNNELIGVGGIWKPQNYKQIKIEDITKPVHELIKKVRPFINLPLKQQTLKSLYITNLAIKNVHKKALNGFLQFIYENELNHGFQIISFSNFDSKNYAKALKGFIYSATRLNLYKIDLKKQRLDELISGQEHIIFT